MTGSPLIVFGMINSPVASGFLPVIVMCVPRIEVSNNNSLSVGSVGSVGSVNLLYSHIIGGPSIDIIPSIVRVPPPNCLDRRNAIPNDTKITIKMRIFSSVFEK